MGKDLRGKEIGRGLCQRKNGTYQARIFKPGYGKPVYLYNKNLKELKKEKSDLEHAVRYGDFPQSNKLTVDGWFSEWMSIYCIPNLKNTTIGNYVNSYNRTPSYHKDGNGLAKGENVIQITSPKKEASYRYVPLNDNAIAAFQTWVCKQAQDRKKYKKTWGQSNPLFTEYPDLVFTTEKGNAYLPVYAEAECRRIEKIINNKEKISAGEEKRKPEYIHIYPHIFRHTFISCCVESGMSPASIMKIAGHSDEKMLKHYSHISTDYSQNEFKKFKINIKTT